MNALAPPVVRRATLIALAGALALYVAITLTGVGGARLDAFASTWMYSGLLVAGALVCLARVVAVPGDRLAWGLVATGLGAWAAADLYSELALADLAEPPYPSLADAGWLAFYPTSYAAVLLLARRGPRLPAGIALDGAIAALAAAALATAVLFAPVIAGSLEGALPAVLTNLAYPVGDLLLLGLVVLLSALRGWRADRAWLLLGGGLALSAVADSWYLAEIAQGTYAPGGVLDTLWPASMLLIAWAAWQPRRQRGGTATGERRLVAIPAAFALTGLALLIVDHFHRINDVALVLASATMVVAVLRMALAFGANMRMLDASRREAVTDALTGLGNRRRLMHDLESSVDDPGVTLVMFDLDGFKRYNDTFGHPAGDALLQRLARCLAGATSGQAFRMGGDEFCVLLRVAPGEREAAIVAAKAALSERGEGFAIGASHGAVVPAVEAATAAEALQIADQRMYFDKAGRAAGRTSETRDVLLRILREREPGLHDHLASVAELAHAVSVRLGLLPEALDEATRAAELHDIGKMAIPDAILDKPEPLDDHEWAFMRRHTIIGEAILSAAPALVPVARIVRSSHERIDGAGYPDRLAGDAIPLGSRIVAVCDAYDAMTSDRSYRRAMSSEAALAELRAGAGTQFDASVVEELCAVLAGLSAGASAAGSPTGR